MEPSERQELTRERLELLGRLEDWLERPMVLLAFVWLGLLVGEVVYGESRAFEVAGLAIWLVFIVDFSVKLALAPDRLRYLRNQWFTALSLALPALRVFRFARAFRLLRYARAQSGFRLIRVLGSVNRSMRALAASFNRRGFGYALALTLIVLLGGAAGMYAFEREAPAGFEDFWTALWWTAMVLTTMGSEYWPRTPEGRLLCLALAIYAFAVFGYVTASIATFFVGRDADNDHAEIAGAQQIAQLRAEMAALRAELQALSSAGGALAKGDGRFQ
jgi:voltage-gated potassium channel